MKKRMLIAASIMFLFLFAGALITSVHACAKNGCICQQFVDEDGDGICDLCNGCIPQGDDADGDGIPNGQDDDYVPPQDGSGQQKGRR